MAHLSTAKYEGAEADMNAPFWSVEYQQWLDRYDVRQIVQDAVRNVGPVESVAGGRSGEQHGGADRNKGCASKL